MAASYDAAIALLTKDPLTAAVLIIFGFLLGHILDAIIFALISGFGNFFQKLGKFFKGLFFIFK